MVMPDTWEDLSCSCFLSALSASPKISDISSVSAFCYTVVHLCDLEFYGHCCHLQPQFVSLDILAVGHDDTSTVITVFVSVAMTTVNYDLSGMEMTALNGSCLLIVPDVEDEKCSLDEDVAMGMTSFLSSGDGQGEIAALTSPVRSYQTLDRLSCRPGIPSSPDLSTGRRGIPSSPDLSIRRPDKSVCSATPDSSGPSDSNGNDLVPADSRLACTRCGCSSRTLSRGPGQSSSDCSQRKGNVNTSTLSVYRGSKNDLQGRLKGSVDLVLSKDKFKSEGSFFSNGRKIGQNADSVNSTRGVNDTFPLEMSGFGPTKSKSQRNKTTSADQIWPGKTRHGKRRNEKNLSCEDVRGAKCWVASEPTRLSRSTFFDSHGQCSAYTNKDLFPNSIFTLPNPKCYLHSKERGAYSQSHPNLPLVYRPAPPPHTDSTVKDDTSHSNPHNDIATLNVESNMKTLSHPAFFKHVDETSTSVNCSRNSSSLGRPKTLSCKRNISSGSFDNLNMKDFDGFPMKTHFEDSAFGVETVCDVETCAGQIGYTPSTSRNCGRESASLGKVDSRRPRLQCTSTENRSRHGSVDIPEGCEEARPLLGADPSYERKQDNPHRLGVCHPGSRSVVDTATTSIQLRVQCPTDEEDSDGDLDGQAIEIMNCPANESTAPGCFDDSLTCDVASHRKRKFRRKRSFPLILNSFIPKSKRQGKTKKLCKQRKEAEAQEPLNTFNVVVTAEERHPLHQQQQQPQQQQHHYLSSRGTPSPYQSSSNIRCEHTNYNPSNHHNHCNHHNHYNQHNHLNHFNYHNQHSYNQHTNHRHSATSLNQECELSTITGRQRWTSPPHNTQHNTWAAPSRPRSPSPPVARVSFSYLNGYGSTRGDLLTDSGLTAPPGGLKTARPPKQYQSSSSVTTSNGSRPALLHPTVQDLRRQPGNLRATRHIPRTLTHHKQRRRGGQFTVTPVNNDANLRDQTCGGRSPTSSNLRVPVSTFDIDGEPTDTLTQNSITSLLSSKFRDVAKRWKQYGVDSPRFRKRIHSKWESMNYEELDSQLARKHREGKQSKKKLALEMFSSWVIFFFIGIGTAFLAAGVQISVELIAHQKFELLRDYFDKCDAEGCLYQPVLIWMGINAGITLVGAALVTYVQPMAAGSGIPLIKSYLNGVRVPGLLSLRAFIAKCVGVVLSILGGLACGKEGPMAHSGGIMAAGLGKGRIPWFGKDINLYGLFRNDHNIRDLVAAGAASGVSAAFGAPIGGTLFSVEEAASFWNTELVWKVFFSAMIACFSTNVLLSAFEGHPTQLSNPGLVRFKAFPELTFDLIEIPVFIIIAAIGGLTGSLFVVMNYKLTVFRQKYLHRKKWIKVLEAGLVSVVSAIAAFLLMFSVKDCTDAPPDSHHAITTRLGCSGESHNSMSTMFLTTPEGCLKALLHDPLETYSVMSLVLFVVVFFLLGVWTYGLSVSSGVFIPSLAIGAAWGRLIGLGVVQLFPDQAKDVGKYALIGAASQLGGILRTTISLTVIIVECTGDITFGLCIMISLMISKWVGDFFTTGLYDMNVEVSGIPLLSWEPPPLCEDIHVSDFMSQPVMTLLSVERVGHIYDCLSGESFNGFPVIEQDPNYDLMYRGKLKGIILRHQLLVLLKKKMFCPEGQMPTTRVQLKDFDNPYPVPQRLKIQDIELTDADKQCVMDLTPYMNLTPYTASISFSMPRVFRLFRGLGLRHLVVVNDNTEPIGMVTRKDLAKYRAEIKKGMLHMEQLTVENR